MRSLGRFLVGTVIVLAVLAALPFVALNLWILLDNRLYPSRVFADDVPVARVLGGKRWGWVGPSDIDFFGGGDFICVYAVVELAEDAPSVPPMGETNRRTEQFERWKPYDQSEWVATPMPKPKGGCECTARDYCELFTGSRLWDRIEEAMSEPGGYYYQAGNARVFYSKPANLAFRLEETD